MNQSAANHSIEAEIYSSAVKDPQLSDNAFISIMNKAAQMDIPDAMHVLENCVKNSALNRHEHIKAISLTTDKCLASSDAKKNFIYQTLLERENLSAENIDYIARSALKNQHFTTSEARTAETILSKSNISKETANYLNNYIDKFPNDKAYKGTLIGLLMNHPEFGLNQQLADKVNTLTEDGQRCFNQERKIANNKRIKGISQNLAARTLQY